MAADYDGDGALMKVFGQRDFIGTHAPEGLAIIALEMQPQALSASW